MARVHADPSPVQVPNPLFDLAGAFSGYLLVPFWTFFVATAIGKAVNKVTLQACVPR